MAHKQMRPLAEVYFGVTLSRRRSAMTLDLEVVHTFTRPDAINLAGEWEPSPQPEYDAMLKRIRPAEQKRAAAVAAALARLLKALTLDLACCNCAPGDRCPKQRLMTALMGKAIK